MSVRTFIMAPQNENRPQPEAVKPVVTFLDYVRADLEAVEDLMQAQLGSQLRTVHALTGHIFSAGGKRLRPAMVALSARAIQPEIGRERIAVIGSAIEFVHMATLVHDDVVDNTATRRGKPTANAVFGNGVAVLSGDYILARSMRLLADDGDLRIIRLVSDITMEMSEGEVMEIGATGQAELPMETYLEILHKKTASFVEGCCRCGATLAEAEPAQLDALATYGYRLGMAFQLADDLLDYTGDPCITGKPRGSDLRDGRATLPFLLGMEAATPTERHHLMAGFGCAELDDSGVLEVCTILSRYDAFDRTREAAHDQVDQAAAALDILPPTTARDCFAALTDYVVERDR